MNEDLVGRLRAWSRRYEPHSQERRLMLEAAVALEQQPTTPPQGITVDMVEAAMGGRKLLTWQIDALGGKKSSGAPPSFRGK